VRFEGFEADTRAGELRKQGRKIKLQEKPFQLLCTLLQHPGEVVTREELRERLWPADTFVVFDDNLNTAIKKLREALGIHKSRLSLSPAVGSGLFGLQPWLRRLWWFCSSA
jgi:DNA-binding winged helix-turn-helix (wHTH) protein